MKKTLYVLLISFSYLFCKRNIKDESSKIALTNSVDKILESDTVAKTSKNIEVKILLDSLSKKVELPYGNVKIKSIDFPKQWYCGGGYLNGSLKKNGHPNQDSVVYSKDFFSILESQRNLSFKANNKVNSKLLNSKKTIFSKYYSYTQKDSVYNFFYPYVKLPNTKNYSVYGVITRQGNIHYNPVFFLMDSNNEITDYLSSFELSKSSVMINKVVYIDSDYIFTVASFYTLDGYEVETGIKEQFIIKEGKFVKYHKDDGDFKSKIASGKVENNVRVGKWKEYTFENGRPKPIYYLESNYNNGQKDGIWSYYNIDKTLEKTRLKYTETYKEGKLIKKEFVQSEGK